MPSKVAKMTRGLVALMPDKSGSQTSDKSRVTITEETNDDRGDSDPTYRFFISQP